MLRIAEMLANCVEPVLKSGQFDYLVEQIGNRVVCLENVQHVCAAEFSSEG